MNIHDVISSMFWLAIGIFFSVEGLRLDIGTLSVPGPGFVVLLAGVVLGLFSLILLVKTIFVDKKEKKALSGLVSSRQVKVIFTVCAIFAYLLLLPRVGFFISTFVLMTFMYRLLGQNIWLQVAIGLLTTALAYLVFTVWLRTATPKGIFGF